MKKVYSSSNFTSVLESKAVACSLCDAVAKVVVANETVDVTVKMKSEIVHKNRVFIDKSSYFRMLIGILRDFKGALQSLVCMSTVLFIH